MAITLGTPTSSGNQTGTTGYTFAHTTAANTKALVVVVTGADSSDADAAATVTFNNISVPSVRRYLVNPYQVWIFSLPLPPIGTYNVVVTHAGANTDSQATAIGLISSTADRIVKDNFAESTTGATTTHTLVVNPAKTGSVAIGGIVDIQSVVTALSVTSTYGTEITGSEADMGSQVVGCAYRAESGGTAEIRWTKSAGAVSYALIHTFYEQNFPAVALNTPADAATNQSLTPDLVFTGTDTLADTIEYEVQVDTVNTFNSPILFSKLSSVPDNTFTDLTNGADTHPFASADQIKYAVQSDLNTETTYYWRVRAIDPTGSNAWGAWATTRSFTTLGKRANIVESGAATSTQDATILYAAPHLTADSPANSATGQSLLPALRFTGTDDGGSTIEYEIQVDTVNTFDSISVAKSLKYIDINLNKNGTPTGNIFINICTTSPSGTIVATSDNVAASTLSDSTTKVRFTFSTPYSVSLNTTYYFVVCRSVYDATNIILISVINLSSVPQPEIYNPLGYTRVNSTWLQETFYLTSMLFYDSTASYISGFDAKNFGGAWEIAGDNAGSNIERIALRWMVNKTNPFLYKLSSLPDTGFLDITDNSDTHPFDSGDQIQYQLQAANILAINTVYYWRVRGIDPAGNNIWGPWTATRSFTTGSGSSAGQVKSFLGVIEAQIKTMNGLANASIKSIDGKGM